MRRFAVGSAVLGVFAAALGCQHIGGMNDVYHHPDNAIINTGNGNPYHTTGSPILSVSTPPSVTEMKPAESTMPKPAEAAPKPMPMEGAKAPGKEK
jgi:hypothetical protein